jgi:hypothetical protein
MLLINSIPLMKNTKKRKFPEISSGAGLRARTGLHNWCAALTPTEGLLAQAFQPVSEGRTHPPFLPKLF